jgi:murein DD-endopeptidase MepM/ murein hydrolase activator NlpD
VRLRYVAPAGVGAFVIAAVAAVMLMWGSLSGGGDDSTDLGGGSCAGEPAAPAPVQVQGPLDQVQLRHAGEIIAAGRAMGVPERGQVIAIAVALQESSLRIVANPAVPESMSMPHDSVAQDGTSVGLFAQLDQGWGTLAQRMDPTQSAQSFFRALLAVPGWQSMALTDAAQQVQRSAFPNAYAKWETMATKIVTSASPDIPPEQQVAYQSPDAQQGDCTPPPADPGATSQMALPVPRTYIPSVATLQAPHHDIPGLDIPVPFGTPIYAVEAGTVTIAGFVSGFGDHAVYVKSADGWTWIYGHGSGLHVTAGQQVQAGQLLADAGSEGESTGPHLHLGLLSPGGVNTCPQDWIVHALIGGDPPPKSSLSTVACIGGHLQI